MYQTEKQVFVVMTTRQSTWGMGRVTAVPPDSKVLVFCSLYVRTQKSNNMHLKFNQSLTA